MLSRVVFLALGGGKFALAMPLLQMTGRIGAVFLGHYGGGWLAGELMGGAVFGCHSKKKH